MKNRLITAALGFALGLPLVANAYLFDPDGLAPGNTAVNITALDWAPSNVLARGGNLAVANFLANQQNGNNALDTTFKIFGQAQLIGTLGTPITGICTPTESTCNGGQYEITLTLGFTEKVTGVSTSFPPGATASASFDYVNDGTSFFNIFYDPNKNSNNLTGLGFDDGLLILSSQILPPSSGTFTSYPTTGQAFDATTDGNQYPGITTIQTPPSGGQNSDLLLNITLSTVPGILYRDPNFFTQVISSFRFNNIQLSPQFTSVDPSRLFDGFAGGGNGGTIAPSIGLVNGALYNGTNPDFQLQTDTNSPISAATVPEPATLGLLGIALVGLGFGTRRRRV